MTSDELNIQNHPNFYPDRIGASRELLGPVQGCVGCMAIYRPTGKYGFQVWHFNRNEGSEQLRVMWKGIVGKRGAAN